MKLSVTCAALAFTGVLSAQGLAAEGKVHFSGNITAESCTINSSDINQTVELGTVTSALFDAAGDKSNAVDFSINMTGCPATVASVQTKFDGVPDPDNTDLLALDSASTASAVGIGLEETDGTPIPLHTASREVTVESDTHAATLTYQARYVATAAQVSPGTANGVTQFSLNYN